MANDGLREFAFTDSEIARIKIALRARKLMWRIKSHETDNDFDKKMYEDISQSYANLEYALER